MRDSKLKKYLRSINFSKCVQGGFTEMQMEIMASEMVYDLWDEIKRLQAIVDKLPKTKDGVTVTPGMELFRLLSDGRICSSLAHHIHSTCVESFDGLGGAGADANGVLPCYATEKAAQTAKEIKT